MEKISLNDLKSLEAMLLELIEKYKKTKEENKYIRQTIEKLSQENKMLHRELLHMKRVIHENEKLKENREKVRDRINMLLLHIERLGV